MLIDIGQVALRENGYKPVKVIIRKRPRAAFSDGRTTVMLRAQYTARHGPEYARLFFFEVE